MNRIVRAIAAAAAAWVVAALGCQRSPNDQVPPVHAPSAQDIPTAVSIGAQDASMGFAAMTPRQRAHVQGFRISKHPTTVAQYRACVQAGVCRLPTNVGLCTAHNDTSPIDGPTHSVQHGAQMPMTCVSAEQAERFCGWVGGTLPTLAQWLVAARGTEPQLYAWGDDPPTCEKHPWAYGMLANRTSCCKQDPGCTVDQLASVGAHPAGASAAGVHDVLLSPAEIVSSSAQSPCAGQGQSCAVFGQHGAIGSVEQLVTLADGEHVARLTSSFRCVWEDGR